MQITIKPLTPVDYGEIAEISNRAYQFMQKYYSAEEKKTLGREESSETIKDQLEDRIGVVAENEHGRVLGFMLWQQYGDMAWISNIAVDPLYQKKGVGAALVNYLEQWVVDRDMHTIMLEVHKRNQKSHKFYEHIGYKELTEAEINNNYGWPFARSFMNTQDVFGKTVHG